MKRSCPPKSGTPANFTNTAPRPLAGLWLQDGESWRYAEAMGCYSRMNASVFTRSGLLFQIGPAPCSKNVCLTTPATRAVAEAGQD